jgi:hypothetical protein
MIVSNETDYEYLNTFSELPDSAIEAVFQTGREEELPENRVSVMPNLKLWVSAERVPTTISVTAGPVLTMQLETTERDKVVMEVVEAFEEDNDGIEKAEITLKSKNERDTELADEISEYVKSVQA